MIRPKTKIMARLSLALDAACRDAYVVQCSSSGKAPQNFCGTQPAPAVFLKGPCGAQPAVGFKLADMKIDRTKRNRECKLFARRMCEASIPTSGTAGASGTLPQPKSKKVRRPTWRTGWEPTPTAGGAAGAAGAAGG